MATSRKSSAKSTGKKSRGAAKVHTRVEAITSAYAKVATFKADYDDWHTSDKQDAAVSACLTHLESLFVLEAETLRALIKAHSGAIENPTLGDDIAVLEVGRRLLKSSAKQLSKQGRDRNFDDWLHNARFERLETDAEAQIERWNLVAPRLAKSYDLDALFKSGKQ